MDLFTEAFIKAAVQKFGTRAFRAPQNHKLISTPFGTSRVRIDTEDMIFLPNGHMMKVWTDASGVATQVEDDEHQHAIVRPNVYRPKARL